MSGLTALEKMPLPEVRRLDDNPPSAVKTCHFAIAIILGVVGIGLIAIGIGGVSVQAGFFAQIGQPLSIVFIIGGAISSTGGLVIFIIACRRNRKTSVQPRIEESNLSQIERANREKLKKVSGLEYFGAQEWRSVLGDPGEEPTLPNNIAEILNRPCPSNPKKTVAQTSMLVLMPATINGNKLTLNSFENLIAEPRAGHSAAYDCNVDRGAKIFEESIDTSYWILILKEPPQCTYDRKTFDQQKLILSKEYPNYRLPSLMEAVVSTMLKFVTTGESPYSYSSNKGRRYTVCDAFLKQKDNISVPITIGNIKNEKAVLQINLFRHWNCDRNQSVGLTPVLELS